MILTELLDYKCPNCNASINFDSQTQRMQCPYCDTTIDIESLRQMDNILNESLPENMEWSQEQSEYFSDEDTQGMNVYVCQSCGGEVVSDETTAATQCPFCDNNVVIKSRFSGDLKPDVIIPFMYDKKNAKEALGKHVNQRFVPQVFKDENHIDEIKGVYVPVWLFDSKVDAQYVFHGEIIRTYSDANYDYTETSVYLLNRSGSLAFKEIPVDGSTKMDDDLMESVEPFDISQTKSFQTAYLSGYLANRYDVNVDECIKRANERIRYSTEEVFRGSTAGYSNVTVQSGSISLRDNSYKYAMYPVWLLNTSWNGRKFSFAMNGQSGKIVGNLPMDKAKAALWMTGLTVINSALIYLIAWLLR